MELYFHPHSIIYRTCQMIKVLKLYIKIPIFNSKQPSIEPIPKEHLRSSHMQFELVHLNCEVCLISVEVLYSVEECNYTHIALSYFVDQS